MFKSGDRSVPLNYRPISLTNYICKFLEHVIHTQVISYLEENEIIFKYQHVFARVIHLILNSPDLLAIYVQQLMQPFKWTQCFSITLSLFIPLFTTAF